MKFIITDEDRANVVIARQLYHEAFMSKMKPTGSRGIVEVDDPFEWEAGAQGPIAKCFAELTRRFGARIAELKKAIDELALENEKYEELCEGALRKNSRKSHAYTQCGKELADKLGMKRLWVLEEGGLSHTKIRNDIQAGKISAEAAKDLVSKYAVEVNTKRAAIAADPQYVWTVAEKEAAEKANAISRERNQLIEIYNGLRGKPKGR